MMRGLSDFAAIAVRHQQDKATALQQEAAASAAKLANEIAHQINNPLQGLVNTVYLARWDGANAEVFLQAAEEDLTRISDLVRKLLSLRVGQ
jgi:nitrogen-specific signal transduction histidine kinase